MADDFDSDKIMTVVDHMMHVISKAKKIQLNQLVADTGIPRKDLETWLKVLEEQGFVRMDYSIGSIFVTWTGEPAEKFEHEGETEHKHIIESMEEKYESEHHVTEREDNKSSDYVEYQVPRSEEHRLKFERDHYSAKDSILGKMADEPTKPGAKAKEEKPPEAQNEISESDEIVFPAQSEEEIKPQEKTKNIFSQHLPEEPDVQAESQEEAEKPFMLTVQEMPKAAKREKTIKNVVSEYLDEINRQKSIVESLKREKEHVHRKKYLSLESKIESDLATITEKILEKESRIIELRERALELPDKVEELAKLQKNISRIEIEGRAAISSAKEKMNSFMAEMKKTRDAVNEKIDRNKAVISAGKQKVSELESTSSQLEANVTRINERAAEMRASLEKMGTELQGIYDELEEVTAMKTQITEIINSVGDSMETKEEELESLAIGLDDLEKIEQWVEEYVNDYENKMESLESYVHEGEEELHKLRETSEAEYIRKYLKELETLTLDYERELEAIGSEEKGIDTRINEAKEHLETLVSESKSVLRKFRNEQSTHGQESFENIAMAAKEKLEKSRAITREKSRERETLRTDIRSSRGNREKKQAEVKTKARERRKKGKKK